MSSAGDLGLKMDTTKAYHLAASSGKCLVDHSDVKVVERLVKCLVLIGVEN